MSPLPGYRVIPEKFEQHHRPTVDSTRTSPGTITRVTSGPPPFPKPEGWTGTGQIYSGTFRVQELNNSASTVPAEQPTRERQYLVVAGLDVPALQTGERGDIIHVEGRELRVQQVLFGSLLWEVDLICSDNMTQQNPT